jgi:hypothetical protein
MSRSCPVLRRNGGHARDGAFKPNASAGRSGALGCLITGLVVLLLPFQGLLEVCEGSVLDQYTSGIVGLDTLNPRNFTAAAIRE